MPLLFTVPCLIVIANWLWPLPLPLWLKLSGAVLIGAGAHFYTWSRLSSGSPFSPEFPRPVVILFNWAFAAIGFLAVFQLILDLAALVQAVMVWHMPHIPTACRSGAGALAALLSALGVINAVRVPPIKDIAVTIPGLPASFDGYRLLQLTDLHISKLFPRTWAQAVVDHANMAGADMIVVTGDFIDGSVAMRQKDCAPLHALHAPDGVFAVPGNHEYFFDYAEWMQHLSALGFQLLLNTHIVIARGNDKLTVAGVTDLSAQQHNQDGPDLAAALRNAPPDAPVILLDHQPRQALAAAQQGVALQLSGHTHGGMIKGLDRLVARGNKGFVSGAYTLGGMTLYVSNGTGLWPGFALRLGVPPEMTRISLRADSVTS